MEQKKFMDISRVKFGDELTPSNTGGFEVGDRIQITEKWDGSNASIRYDVETGKLVAFSRRLELTYNNTLMSGELKTLSDIILKLMVNGMYMIFMM